MSEETEQKFAFVAVLGSPNVGKSTLVNQLTGAKVSIVSPKAQTTRCRIRGIVINQNTQLVLVDTPGIFKASRQFERAMVASAWTGSAEADLRLLVVDATKGGDKATRNVIEELKKTEQKAILVINKIDLTPKELLLPLIKELNEQFIFQETFLISAKTGEQTEELKTYLCAAAPKGSWMFPKEHLSDLPNRLFAAEITREKMFLYLQKELPYTAAVTTFQWKETQNGIRIEQIIFVERESLKPIVIGKGGSMLKKIGQSARHELSRCFETPVQLFLTVRVKENWSTDPARYAEWGLDYNV